MTPAAAAGLMGHSSAMLPRMGNEQRTAIIAIKRRVWASENYHRAFWAMLQKPGCFAGVTVYEAVLDHGVRTIENFTEHLRNRRIPVTPHERLDRRGAGAGCALRQGLPGDATWRACGCWSNPLV